LLTQIAPGNAIEAISRPGTEASDREGFESLGPGNVAAAESGLQKLAVDRVQEITPSEMFGLEAIVLPRNRPVAFVRGKSSSALKSSGMATILSCEFNGQPILTR
jgi:hypothetical protein